MTSICFKYLTINDVFDNFYNKINYNHENKEKYGEVHTPVWFIELLLDRVHTDTWKNPDIKWLDTGAGQGRITLVVYYRLMNSLIYHLPDRLERHNHIIENMLYMVEINKENIEIIKQIFGSNVNVLCCDYLDETQEIITPHIIIGNPPFNANGIKKVPTNNEKKKGNDGSTIWCSFVQRSLEILPHNGYLYYIIPIIWLKPDKAGIYNLLTKHADILYVRSFTNTETNKIFNKEAQTPTCIVCLQKKEQQEQQEQQEHLNPVIQLYDNIYNNYVSYTLLEGCPIPVNGASILNKIWLQMVKYNIPSMKSITHKTNMPSTHTTICDVNSYINNDYNYPNIHSCVLDGKTASLKVMYSDKPCAYNGVEKLVLAHKMYGFPFYDIEGHYGISNRDNYVILIPEIQQLSKEERRKVYEKYKRFLTSKFAIFLFSTTTYRMKYLEKYIFELLPQIHLIPEELPLENCNDTMNFFELNQTEKDYVTSHIKDYIGF